MAAPNVGAVDLRGRSACWVDGEETAIGSRLLYLAVLFVAALIGLGGYTFLYAEGASYLTNDPAACTNCHIMQAQFDGWTKGSHHAVAVCNDCHLPPSSVVSKLWVKGINGFNHALAFTTGRYPDPIMITPFNRAVTEDACRSCHRDVVQAIDARPREPMACTRCHWNVGHAH